MKKTIQLLGNDNHFTKSIGLTSLFTFLILNILAIVVYIKYLLGFSNSFITLLPAIKILLNTDFLFVVVLIFIYNAAEKFFGMKTILAAIILISIGEALYLLMKDKPFAIIFLLGLYGIGISIFTSVIGLDAMIRIATKNIKVKS
ncbi:hypothetical protein [Geosporobacter ferrireducens]|uniref:Uncharacterized protein n=1 Tax=Geosporobacter ferrireducens TaxID=1424294 RepID=A0A1D8GCL4_9FIRM|nr:hypothetical protein [Geosporobacter ferrireducens]AOT68651.1 hypothetical protein Gferi_02985 [Geosporobacter ferrireducens]MTI54126.1 hypothetical protein [Geosporobacter ferrireducens]